MKRFNGDQTKVLTVVYSPLSEPPGDLFVMDLDKDSKEMHKLGED